MTVSTIDVRQGESESYSLRVTYNPGVFRTGVTGATDNGSGLVRITVDSTANLATGDRVSISGVTGSPSEASKPVRH